MENSILEKYSENGVFFLNLDDALSKVCNAPRDKSGIYIVFGYKHLEKNLIYIGRSGKLDKDNKMFIRRTGLGGMKDRIVNGHQFGKVPRRISWQNQMKIDDFDKLEIYWFVTHTDLFCDCPREIENKLLNQFFENNKILPIWNRIF